MVSRGARLLVQWRQDRVLTQWEACEQLGRFSAAEISAFETGRRRPGLKTATFFLEHCAIPMTAWTEAGNGESPDPTPAAKKAA